MYSKFTGKGERRDSAHGRTRIGGSPEGDQVLPSSHLVGGFGFFSKPPGHSLRSILPATVLVPVLSAFFHPRSQPRQYPERPRLWLSRRLRHKLKRSPPPGSRIGRLFVSSRFSPSASTIFRIANSSAPSLTSKLSQTPFQIAIRNAVTDAHYQNPHLPLARASHGSSRSSQASSPSARTTSPLIPYNKAGNIRNSSATTQTN